VQLDDDVKRLSALKRAHGDAKGRNAAERHACAREITATTEQLGRLDEALPRIAASADAPFAMTIGGRTYRERGPASSAVVDTVRQAYSEGKRWGAQKAFPVASLRGVEVLAARLLTSDEVVLSANVPCRTRAVAAKDFTGREANGVGLVRRMENMVAEIPAYRAEVEHRQDFARTRTEELLAVADVPFEHEVALRDKEHELHTLTAQLHLDANSPQAHARAEAARERLAAQGRTPGWSLALNPTPALLKEPTVGAGTATDAGEVDADQPRVFDHGGPKAPLPTSERPVTTPIMPIIGGSMSIIAPVHDRACGCLVAVEGSSRAPGVHARYCGLWAAASTSESVHKVRQILAHRPMNRGGRFSRNAERARTHLHAPQRRDGEFFGVAVPISLDVRLRQAVRQQLGPPPHAPGTLCRALSSRTVSRCSRGVRAVPRPVPPSVLARGHLPLGGAPFCGVASLRVRVRPLHRG